MILTVCCALLIVSSILKCKRFDDQDSGPSQIIRSNVLRLIDIYIINMSLFALVTFAFYKQLLLFMFLTRFLIY